MTQRSQVSETDVTFLVDPQHIHSTSHELILHLINVNKTVLPTKKQASFVEVDVLLKPDRG